MECPILILIAAAQQMEDRQLRISHGVYRDRQRRQQSPPLARVAQKFEVNDNLDRVVQEKTQTGVYIGRVSCLKLFLREEPEDRGAD